jgi:hypothetical protein
MTIDGSGTIYRATGLWADRAAWVGSLSRAAYTGPDGRLYRAPTTFDAKEDAVAWLANRRAEIQREVWVPDHPPAISHAARCLHLSDLRRRAARPDHRRRRH